jgi:hypothetical protein
VLAEYKVSLADPNLADATSEVILFTVDKPQFNHDGGQVAFGPDGYLYFTLGDGGGANDGLADVPPSHGPIGNGQNRFAKLGKIHRIDVDSPPLTSAGWVENPANGHWYRLTSPGLTWQQAEDEAVLLGAHLATINDTEEQTWFNGNPLGEVSGCPLVWIGLYQLPGSPESSDGWVWINGEPVSFTNWRSGEPNDGNICGPSCEQFAEMHYNSEPLGKWNDIPPGGNGCSGGGPGQPGIVERDTAYDVPPDNPFADGVNGLPEIFAYGLRNPWRFSFDDGPGGDEKLWLADVGQGLYEEVNIGALGANYGWVIREGFHCFNPLANTVPPASCATTGGLGEPLVNPVMDYLHRRQCIVDADCAALGVGCDEALGQCENEGGISITGGYVYRGSANPHLIGRYVFGDFSDAFSPAGGRLYYMDTTGPNAFKRRQFFIAPNNPPLGRYVKSFGEDAEGELYVLASTALGPLGTGGVVLRIAPPIPTAAGEGPRYISVEPPPSTEPFALLIAPDCPAATAKYLGPPSGPDTIAHLVDNPVDAAYLTSVQWGRPVHATGADVAPSTNFKVHVDCGTPGSPVLSGGALATTRRWGDVTEPYKPPSDTAQPDFDDISEIVDTFKDAPGSLPPPRVDLVGEGFSPFCIPGGGIDFGDISECVNAFKGFAYPCPSPCP